MEGGANSKLFLGIAFEEEVKCYYIDQRQWCSSGCSWWCAGDCFTSFLVRLL